MNASKYICCALMCMSLYACNDTNSQASRGPIVLGDPATIVTETDPQYLTDFVADVQPRTVVETPAPSAPPASVPDTTAKQADVAAVAAPATPVKDEPAPAPAGNGLSMAFKEVTVFIPGINTKSYKEQHPEKSNGVSYQLVSGKLPGNKLQITKGTVQKVSQRYGTVVVAKRGQETLELASLGTTTGWEQVSGNSNSYPIAGLDAAKLKMCQATPAQIRAAINKAAKAARMNKKSIQEWDKEARNLKSLSGPMFSSKIRSVMWKVDGKDAGGKSFSKQIRIDIPTES